MKSVKVSEAEWEVMNLLWRQSPLSSLDLVKQLSALKSWRSRTIRTLLDRLVKKGAVGFAHDGRRNLYHPQLSQTECLRVESRSFLERVFGGEPGAMLVHLIQETKLSREEIKKLKQILAEKEK